MHSSSASDPFSLSACELTLTVFSPLLSKEIRRTNGSKGKVVAGKKKQQEQNNGATLVAFPSLRAFFALACGNWQQAAAVLLPTSERTAARCPCALRHWTGLDRSPSVRSNLLPAADPPCCLRLVNCERRKAEAGTPTHWPLYKGLPMPPLPVLLPCGSSPTSSASAGPPLTYLAVPVNGLSFSAASRRFAVPPR